MDETSEPHLQEPTPERVAPDEARTPKTVSRPVLLVSVVAAILIAGAAGVVIGWKIEQQRVKDDLANIRPIGAVTAINEDAVTIKLETANGSKTYALTERTQVDGSGEMVEGSTVLVRSWRDGDGNLEADKIVVLSGPTETNDSGPSDG